MSLTWEQVKGDTHLRNVITSQVEDILTNLESMAKRDISPLAYRFAYDQVDGLMVDLKGLGAAFRKKSADGGLLKDTSFKQDCNAIIEWQIGVYNRFDKIKPNKVDKNEKGQNFNQK